MNCFGKINFDGIVYGEIEEKAFYLVTIVQKCLTSIQLTNRYISESNIICPKF